MNARYRGARHAGKRPQLTTHHTMYNTKNLSR